jgi:uncharacterized RDD family membrane protein YckC
MDTSHPLYAGFWRRAAAYVVDGFVLLIPGLVMGYFLGNDQVLALIGQVVLYWLYTALLESGAMQATLGKKAFGIKVTDLAGERISFLRASGRYFGMYLSAVLLGIGFLLAGFTAKKQALHDMLAGCLVVRGQASPEEARAGGTTMPITLGVWGVIVLLFIVPFIGIIAAVAIPAYHDYTVRAKVAEVITAAGPTRDAPAASPYIRRVNGSKQSGMIEIVLEPARLARTFEEGASIRFARDAGGMWVCRGQGVPPRYLPVNCRQ